VTAGAPRGDALDWIGVALLSSCAALAGLLELFYVPLYAGSALVPISVLFAIAFNIGLPRLARTLVQTTLATLLPFLAWLAVVVAIGLTARPEGDVVLPGGGGGVQWVSYGVLLGGAVAGTVTTVLSSGPPARAATPPRVSR
jgi:hypothetical protein